MLSGQQVFPYANTGTQILITDMSQLGGGYNGWAMCLGSASLLLALSGVWEYTGCKFLFVCVSTIMFDPQKLEIGFLTSPVTFQMCSSELNLN